HSEFEKCYAGADFPKDCRPQVEDYYECLAHQKDIAQAKTLQKKTLLRKQAQQLEKEKLDKNVTQSGMISFGLSSQAQAKEAQKNLTAPLVRKKYLSSTSHHF
ncbi:hypothetical protein MJO28_012231, partial [Puccinia striiformis f. sp. tritici]